MKTFATKEKRSASAVRKARPYNHHPMGPVQLAQQAEVRRILRSTGAQAKLTIGRPNDKYEQEADRIADQVIAMPDPALQRQLEGEEEEGLVQTKPPADQITPLLQRQKEPFEEEEELQAKSKPGKIPTVTSNIESHINSLKGGQPLEPLTRALFEPNFGCDLSHVRVHSDSAAAEAAKSINARAFTVNRNIVFGADQYNPGTTEGKRLLAHEVTHVVQQKRGREGSGMIQRWLASEHGRITKDVLSGQYAADWSKDAVLHSAYYSGEMDLRSCNYLWYVPPKIKKGLEQVPIVGPIIEKPKKLPIIGPIAEKIEKAHYGLSIEEAPNHGEANLYEKSNTDPKTGKGKRTWINIDRMKGYAKKAAIKANGTGLNKQVFIELGLALHVGQDRGAHDEGLAGQGHDKPNWKPDDPSVNTAGYAVAKKRTKEVLDLFLSALTADRKKELKTVVLGSLTGPSPVVIGAPAVTTPSPIVDEPELPSRPPLFYMGVTQGMFMDKSGLPVRLGGIFPPLYNTGLVYMGGKGNSIAFDQQIGLRMLRISPKVYVDVFGGGVLGVNFNDKSVMAGISTGVHVTYTGQESDFGVMLNKIWDVTGNRNLLIIGVGGSFDENKWFQ